ncbi:MAG: SO2930 family diheme c-type cytochrome [Hyphomonadaceae bacterium]
MIGRGALLALAALALCVSAIAQPAPPPVDQRAVMAERPPETLAAYWLFTDAGARTPNEGVVPYDLNTALYSDGALKFRYVFLPPGAEAPSPSGDGVLDFPVGTVLIKTFAMAADMRRPSENVRFLETRLLIRREEGWIALPYIWNEAQTEARYEPIGASIPINFLDEAGESVALDWAAPNRNQCKGCHDRRGAITPIGPSLRNLNRDYPYAGGAENQLTHWRRSGMIDALPPEPAPAAPDAYDPASGSVEARARAYLDVNCAHCHNPEGPAHTSGLDLRWGQDDASAWGVLKRPVAAGRGSAGMEFSIAPGHPEQSILLYRMESTDPGVMMPELGRQLVDERAVALMREWIAGMGPDGRSRTRE